MPGESNVGGTAVNADLTAGQLAARSAVQIFNNTTEVFEDLDIGTNNLISHAGLSDNATHGFENGLASTVEAGRWTADTVYLVKCGQGGSKVADWDQSGDTYMSTAIGRIQTAKAELAGLGFSAAPIIVSSIGINDSLAATSTTDFKTGLAAMMALLRAELGATTHVYITHLMSPTYDTYNTAIDEWVASDGNATAFDVSDDYLVDSNHWASHAFEIGAENLVDLINGASGTLSAPTISPATGEYDTTQSVTISGPEGAAIYYTTDGREPTTSDNLYTGAFNVLNSKTIKAIAVLNGYQNSAADTSVLTIWSDWESLTNAANSGVYIIGGGAALPAGGRLVATVDATADFDLIIEVEDGTNSNAIVVYLDPSSGTNYGWDGSNDFLYGVYNYFSGQYETLIGGGNTQIDSNSTFPMLMRLRKSGNDIIVAISTDDGVNWTDTETETNILSGQTTLYVKALFAESAAASRKIKVQVVQ